MDTAHVIPIFIKDKIIYISCNGRQSNTDKILLRTKREPGKIWKKANKTLLEGENILGFKLFPQTIFQT